MTISIFENHQKPVIFQTFLTTEGFKKWQTHEIPRLFLFCQNIQSISLFVTKFQVWVRLATTASLNSKIT